MVRPTGNRRSSEDRQAMNQWSASLTTGARDTAIAEAVLSPAETETVLSPAIAEPVPSPAETESVAFRAGYSIPSVAGSWGSNRVHSSPCTAFPSRRHVERPERGSAHLADARRSSAGPRAASSRAGRLHTWNERDRLRSSPFVGLVSGSEVMQSGATVSWGKSEARL